MQNLNLSDIAAVTRNNDGWGGANGGWILILLFAMIFSGNGFFGARNADYGGYGPYATAASQQEILFGQQFQNIDNKIDRVANGIADATFALNNTVISEGRNTAGAVDKVREGICTLGRTIDGVNYNVGAQSSAIIQANAANTQKILDVLAGNRMADMQNQINQLQLQASLCGVVRYPSASTYYAGANPFCNCNCNGANF